MSDPTPVVTPVATSTGQKIITVGLAILGALPATNIFGSTSIVLKVAGLVVVGLAAIGYTSNSAALQDAHAAGHAAGLRSAATGGQS